MELTVILLLTLITIILWAILVFLVDKIMDMKKLLYEIKRKLESIDNLPF